MPRTALLNIFVLKSPLSVFSKTSCFSPCGGGRPERSQQQSFTLSLVPRCSARSRKVQLWSCPVGQFAWRDALRLPRTRAPSAALPAAAEGFSASWAVPGRSARAALPCSGFSAWVVRPVLAQPVP